MKLSEKGKRKILDNPHWFMNEFEPDDFQGAVILTVEEAEILIRCAANEFCRLILEHAPVDLTRQVEVLMHSLVKRIEQAEGK